MNLTYLQIKPQHLLDLLFIPCTDRSCFCSLLYLCVTAWRSGALVQSLPWYCESSYPALMLQGFADVQWWYYIVGFRNKYIVSNDGVKLFPTRLTPNADWTRHQHTNDTASIYNVDSIKKWMDPSFDLLAVDLGHTYAPGSKIRLQLPLLFPQWHPVVNHLNRWNRERERIRGGCKESKIERVCTFSGNPSRVRMNVSTHYWSSTVTAILYLSPPTSCS